MNNPLVYGIVGLLTGALIASYTAATAVNSNNTGMMGMMGIRYNQSDNQPSKAPTMGMGTSMDDMMNSMKGKSTDDFDQAFLKAMIVHHQGAIEMAQEAKINAKHEEIRKLSDEIIDAQTKEIKDMQSWQEAWGYSQ